LTQPPLQRFNESIVQTDLTRHNAGAMRKRTVGRLCQTPVGPSSAFHRNALQQRRDERGFTLIELLVVIAIIAILIGLLFPAFSAVQNQAKRTQAKNDLTQIVTAVNAYYTEYGKYPRTPTTPGDITYGATATNEQLFNELRSVTAIQNPRGIVFLSPPDVKDVNNPRAGISSAPAPAGQYFDPWGKPYMIRIDTDYDNQVSNPYSQNAGSAPLLQSGVIAWSFGKDALSQSTMPPVDKNVGTNKDDVISWQ
jgi:prepilin-type N-terminal cleavage/methylation domain-containing protein